MDKQGNPTSFLDFAHHRLLEDFDSLWALFKHFAEHWANALMLLEQAFGKGTKGEYTRTGRCFFETEEKMKLSKQISQPSLAFINEFVYAIRNAAGLTPTMEIAQRERQYKDCKPKTPVAGETPVRQLLTFITLKETLFSKWNNSADKHKAEYIPDKDRKVGTSYGQTFTADLVKPYLSSPVEGELSK